MDSIDFTSWPQSYFAKQYTFSLETFMKMSNMVPSIFSNSFNCPLEFRGLEKWKPWLHYIKIHGITHKDA